jgi:hypothetical protein
MPHSSGFAGIGHVTFRVLGGKSGKKRQEVATLAARNGNACGKSGNVWATGDPLHVATLMAANE